VVIDHHFAHDEFGDVILRDVDACATAVVVLELAKALGLDPLPRAAAEPLYAALVADTGSFRYPGTTPQRCGWRDAARSWGRSVARLQPRVRELADGAHAPARVCDQRDRDRVYRACRDPVRAFVHDRARGRRRTHGRGYGRVRPHDQSVEVSIMLWERRPRSDETDFGQQVSRLSLRSAGRVDVSRVGLRSAVGGIAHRQARRSTAICARRASWCWPEVSRALGPLDP